MKNHGLQPFNEEYDRAIFDEAFKNQPLTMNNLFVFMLRNTSDKQDVPAPGLILAAYLSLMHVVTVKLIDAWPDAVKTPRPEFAEYVVALIYYLAMLSANTAATDLESWAASLTRWADKMFQNEPRRHAVVMGLVNAGGSIDKLYVDTVTPEQTEQPKQQ